MAAAPRMPSTSPQNCRTVHSRSHTPPGTLARDRHFRLDRSATTTVTARYFPSDSGPGQRRRYRDWHFDQWKFTDVLEALDVARTKGLLTIGFTGQERRQDEGHADVFSASPADDPRIQETHITLGHVLSELIDRELFPKLIRRTDRGISLLDSALAAWMASRLILSPTARTRSRRKCSERPRRFGQHSRLHLQTSSTSWPERVSAT